MTLTEIMLATTLAACLAVPAILAASAGADRARVTTVQAAVLEAYRTAQAAARAQGRPATVEIAPDSIVVRSLGTADTVVVLRKPGPAAAGVSLTPAGHVATFGPNGLATGAANVTHRLARGATVRQVVVSRLGRARTS
ncbi:MAG: hypothetical protein SFV24_12285 [Gemmatimonadales bacterium]|nr:hypothetical protein [Gemmatimonadales bacterium]